MSGYDLMDIMLKNRILTEEDIEYLESRFKNTFLTKKDFLQFKSDIFDKLDKILKEIISSREEQTIIASKSSNHEDRIEILENVLQSAKRSP